LSYMAEAPAKGETKMVCARVPRPLHNEMRRIAFERDETVQEVLVQLVEKYVSTYGKGGRSGTG
jgi:hypothetical protein